MHEAKGTNSSTEEFAVKRPRILLIATAVAVVLLTASTLPAIAASPADSISMVYFPLGNGATYSCAGGPPFISNNSDESPGNCAIEQIGAPPVGFVCDVRTTITFVHYMNSWVADAMLCH